MRALACALVVTLLLGCGDDSDDSGDAERGGAGSGASGSSAAGASGSGASGSGASGTGGSGGEVGTGGAGGDLPIWAPGTGTTWQWQLSGLPIDTSFEVEAYDVDLFETTQQEIDGLHADGRKVICYFSAGSWESYRPDAGEYPDSIKGSPLDPPFEDELWVDIRSDVLRGLLSDRMDLAAQKSCDAVEPDNVDGYSNDNGLGLAADDQLDFNGWVAGEAHARGLSVGLKNDLDQIPELVSQFDWALNEECFTYDECDLYDGSFHAAGKAVFHAEYVDASQLAAVCAVTEPLGLSTLIKNIQLDAYQLPCP